MNIITLKGIIDEDFVNYKEPSMYIAFPTCTFKCEKDCGKRVCQNSALATSEEINVEVTDIVNRYLSNLITKSIVCSGLEPFDSFIDLKLLVQEFRKKTEDFIIIYSGYKEQELTYEISWLKQYKNIIIKFGRFIPDQESHYDEVLGVNLASPNQYAKRIS